MIIKENIFQKNVKPVNLEKDVASRKMLKGGRKIERRRQNSHNNNKTTTTKADDKSKIIFENTAPTTMSEILSKL